MILATKKKAYTGEAEFSICSLTCCTILANLTFAYVTYTHILIFLLFIAVYSVWTLIVKYHFIYICIKLLNSHEKIFSKCHSTIYYSDILFNCGYCNTFIIKCISLKMNHTPPRRMSFCLKQVCSCKLEIEYNNHILSLCKYMNMTNHIDKLGKYYLCTIYKFSCALSINCMLLLHGNNGVMYAGCKILVDAITLLLYFLFLSKDG